MSKLANISIGLKVDKAPAHTSAYSRIVSNVAQFSNQNNTQTSNNSRATNVSSSVRETKTNQS